ncbi:uncharacterized protein Dana_GF27266 [Drosophila ananassae]|uniref:Gustatory receptor n=1 Tax=Drosophila ananassae TaxID=7217 RepID=A0A0N8P156_DROAN|nr:uncharacterized protein CG32395 [Drosophila ananassae]KPU78988.1 uncharacterized protein Dana_GF27266 [Drosophila ananassae]
MKPVNFLNRCTRLLLGVIIMVTQVCGITRFYYDSWKGRFRISATLNIYSYLIIILLSSLWLAFGVNSLIRNQPAKDLFFSIIILLWWYMVVLDCRGIVRQMNKILHVQHKLSALARSPNVFRIRDLMFLIFAIQNAIRSLCLQRNVLSYLAHGFIIFQFTLHGIAVTYQLQVTINICLYVVLIASYNQLHRCTKRISKDVLRLRNSQVLEIGQVLTLVEQLKKSTKEVIRLRLKLHGITTKLMKIFEFHWLCLLIYGFLQFGIFDRVTQNIYYVIAMCTLYLTYNFTLLKVLTFESRTSRSFSHFHLTNYHHGFDATVSRD